MRTSYGSRYEEDIPLPAEEVPATVNARLALAAANDENGRSLGAELSRAEQQRVEAELWEAQNGKGFGKRSLRAYRNLNDLYGAEAYLARRLGGEISARAGRPGSARISYYGKQLREVRTEIARRRDGGNRVPIAMRAQYSAPRAKGKSPGGPTKASKQITLPTVQRLDRREK